MTNHASSPLQLFMSDIHGEYESFAHVLRSGCGAMQKLIAHHFAELDEAERTELLMLACYPEEKAALVRAEQGSLANAWLDDAVNKLMELVYTRSAEVADEQRARLTQHAWTQLGFEGAPNPADPFEDLSQKERLSFVSKLLRNYCLGEVHLVGDIYDRGPAPDLIMDELASIPDGDIQWGNHDIVWMGAALGQPGCIGHVMRICSRYSNLPILTERYGMDLAPVEEFARKAYADDPCAAYGLKGSAELTEDQRYTNIKVQKAMAIIQYKVEGQLIDENPSFALEDRKLLHRIDYERGTVEIEGIEYELTDKVFPTVDPNDPYRLTPEEAEVLAYLQKTFLECEKLQQHIRLFLDRGGLYRIDGNALMFHACVPLNPDGSLMEVNLFGETLSGKALFDAVDAHVRDAFDSQDPILAKQGRDLLWYLWLGEGSPLFGKKKMATFERYVVDDKQAQAEPKNAFFSLFDDEAAHDTIFRDFGMDPEHSYLVCGHVPVKIKKGESPVRCNGRHFNIDGGFSEAYQPTTGIAGITLVDEGGHITLVEHQPFHRAQGLSANEDISSKRTVVK